MDLGPEASFTKFPAPIFVGESSYYLVRGTGGYKLLSTYCPHSGGEVTLWGTFFYCPDHGWRFELTDGECINGPRARLDSIPVTLRDGRLYAEVPLP